VVTAATLSPAAPQIPAALKRRVPVRLPAAARRRDADVYALCALLVLTAGFGRSFSRLGVPGTPVYVTELALAFVGCATIARHGLKDAWRTWRTRLPVVALGIYIVAGAVAAISGLATAGWSRTLNDIGLLEYALIVPVVALVVDDRARLHLLLRTLLIGSLAAAALYLLAAGAKVAIAWDGVPHANGGAAAGLYMSLFIFWAVARFTGGARWRWPVAAGVACCALAVGLTAVRGAWVGLLLGLLTVALLAPRGRRIVAWALAPAVLLFAIASATVFETASDRLFGRTMVDAPAAAPPAAPVPGSKPPIVMDREYVADDALTDFYNGAVWPHGADGRRSRRTPLQVPVEARQVTNLQPGKAYTVRFSARVTGPKGAHSVGRVGDTAGYGWGQGHWRAFKEHGWVRFERTLRATEPKERLALITDGGRPAAFDAVTIVAAGKGRPAADPLGMPADEPRKDPTPPVAPRGADRPPPPPASAGPAGDGPAGPESSTPGRDRTPPALRELDGLVASGSGQEEDNRDWRLAFWRRSIETGLDHPLLGIGFGKPLEFVWDGRRYDFRKGDASHELDVTAPHNEFVHVLARMGLPGFLALLALIAIAGWRGIQAMRTARLGKARSDIVALTAMLAAAVAAVALNDALKGPFMALFFWTLLALLLIAPRLGRGER
jgi:O-antigen ligase